MLERSRAAIAGVWEPAPGVTNYTVLMEPADAPWYLRLRRQSGAVAAGVQGKPRHS
jgi:hypothetical protein